MKQKIIYAVIVLITLYTGAIYVDTELRFLLAFEVVLPFLSMAWILFVGRRFHAEIKENNIICRRKDNTTAVILMENQSFFPAVKEELYLERQKSSFGELYRWKQNCGQIDPGAKEEKEILLDTSHCGIYFVRLRKIRLYDSTGIFSLCRKCREQLQVMVAPGIYEFQENYREELLEIFFNGIVDGADENMDQYQIREYRPGDSMHRVHWKLSAKSDGLQIREFEKENEKTAGLLLDIYMKEYSEKNEEWWDFFLETAASLLSLICRNGMDCQVFWYDACEKRYTVKVNGEQNINKCMYQILEMTPQKLRREALTLGQADNSIPVLSMDGNLHKDGVLLLALNKEKTAWEGNSKTKEELNERERKNP